MYKLFVVVCCSAFFLCACSNEQELTPAPSVNTAKIGCKLLVVLPETHKDGATWHLADNFDHRVVERMNEEWHGPEKGIYYHLQAYGSGSCSLNFVKRMYTDTLDQVTYIIEVKP